MVRRHALRALMALIVIVPVAVAISLVAGSRAARS
jgi:hypothetical protein